MKNTNLNITIIALVSFASISVASAEELIINGQINLNDVISTVNVDVPAITQTTKIVSTAYGNNYVLSAANDSVNLNNVQNSRTDNIISTVNVNVNKTHSVDVSSEVYANRLVVTAQNKGGNSIYNNQSYDGAIGSNKSGDPISELNLNVADFQESKLVSKAGGNMALILLSGKDNSVNSVQSFGATRDSEVFIDSNATDSANTHTNSFGNSLTVIIGRPD